MKQLIEQAWENRALLNEEPTRQAVVEAVDMLDRGELRAIERTGGEGTAPVANQWVKQAILLYFQLQGMQPLEAGPMEYHDKIPLKRDYARRGVRVVPPAVARHGAYLAPGTILMPSYVNIGAYVDSGTMVDTWATVGSCAQVGKNVHLSGGVGLGGVLEPLQAKPVVVEDNCFIGSRSIIVEGAWIDREAVIGAGVVITGSTKIIDVTESQPITHTGYVPPRSVVIPGSYTKQFPAGEYQVPCALIIGRRKESTDLKTSLNDALRLFN